MAEPRQGDLASRIDTFRHHYEPTHHWEARKAFILRNSDNYPEHQLISMSMVWANMQFDGCKYDRELMEKIRELAAGIEVDGRLSKQKYAPELMERVNTLGAGIEIGKSCQTEAPKRPPLVTGSKRKSKPDSDDDDTPATKFPRKETGHTKHSDNHPPSVASQNPNSSVALNPAALQQLPTQINKLVVKEAANPLGVLGNALAKFSLRPEFTYADRSQIIQTSDSGAALSKKGKVLMNHRWESILHINGVYVTSAESSNKPEAKRLCGEKAIVLLRNEQLIVRDVTRNINGQRITRPELIALSKKGNNSDSGSETNQDKQNPLSRLVIMEYPKEISPICTIMNSCQVSKHAVSFEFKDLTQSTGGQKSFVSKHVCKVIIEGQVVGVGVHAQKKDAKRLAAEKALTRLRKTCPTIKVNPEIEEAISKSQVMSTAVPQKQVLPDSNIGSKLMKKMGWSGGGLGKEGNKGIEEPIAIEERHRREGLGMGRPAGTDKIDFKTAQEIIKNYALSDNQDDLVFSSELNNDERKLIHQAAGKFGLKSKSYGSGDGRYLVIKKIRDANEIVEHLTQSGGSSARYELVLPGQ